MEYIYDLRKGGGVAKYRVVTRKRIRDIQAAQQRPDRPGEAEARVRDRRAGEQAHAEAMARFGTITVENFAQACEWQENRRRELLATRGGTGLQVAGAARAAGVGR